MTGDVKHIPVLAEETLSLLMPDCSVPWRVIDGTVGFGGHSARILERNPRAEILGIDRDECALSYTAERLAAAGSRIRLMHDAFSNLAPCARACGWNDGVDGILLDIGVSSVQLDDPERGFSWKGDGPLDMRMDRSRGCTAADLLMESSEAELARIFRDYGDFRESAALARAVTEERKKAPFVRCAAFTALCDRVLGGGRKKSGPPAPTLPYQALRIAVNGELKELEDALAGALEVLRPGGRLCVISFHSLEDRIVKNFFRDEAALCKCPPGLPVCVCGWKPRLRILTKKPVTASEAELAANSRCACAKLRAAERI